MRQRTSSLNRVCAGSGLAGAAGGDSAERTHILQTGAVLVLVEVVALPEAQQVVKVVEQAARVLLGVLLLPQGVEVEGQFGLSSGQHQDHQAGVQTTDVLLQPGPRWEKVENEVGSRH